jgi:hypothetical protein
MLPLLVVELLVFGLFGLAVFEYHRRDRYFAVSPLFLFIALSAVFFVLKPLAIAIWGRPPKQGKTML